jgi:hypothetical protein
MADLNLRPMTLGEVLDHTFRLYKNHFWLFAGITALPFLLILVCQIALAAFGNGVGQPAQPPTISPGYLGSVMAGGTLLLVLYFLMVGYAHAATIFAVSDLYLARPATVRGSFARVGAKVFRILVIFFLLFLVVIVGIVAVAIVAGVVAAILRSPVLTVFLIFLAFIPALIFFCRTALAIPTAMLENVGAVRSLERSIHLTKGFGLHIFVIYLLAGFLTYAVMLVFQMPFLALAIKSAASHTPLAFGIVVLQDLGTFISQVLVGPIATIATSLMYYNLRVRKEAFDIQHLMSSLQGPAPSARATI